MRLISTWTNIQNIPRKKGRPSMLNDEIKEKLDIFLSDNTNSFTLPGCNNQIYFGKNEHGESIFKPKKYVLCTFSELAAIVKDNPDPDLSDLKLSIT